MTIYCLIYLRAVPMSMEPQMSLIVATLNFMTFTSTTGAIPASRSPHWSCSNPSNSPGFALIASKSMPGFRITGITERSTKSSVSEIPCSALFLSVLYFSSLPACLLNSFYFSAVHCKMPRFSQILFEYFKSVCYHEP